MKHLLKLSSFVLFLITSLALHAEKYYINSEIGSDENIGTSENSPWKSIQKVNRTTFLPGDSILFSCGGVWYEPLMPLGSGEFDAPIVISSYGSGYMPLFIGNGITDKGVVNLYNQSYWEISNLEITNDAPEYGNRKGVEIIAENYGVSKHIHLKNLRIHHIKGIPGNDSKAKRTAGIFIVVTDDKQKATRFDDILIEDCTIHDVLNQGIAFNNEGFETKGYPGEGQWSDQMFTSVVIRNNVIYNISKNAMIIRMAEGGVVENNVCFNTATMTTGNTIFSRNAKGTVFQYNEGFLNKSHDHDGSFYDPDLNSPETIWQYSYSHNNAHGMLWLCTKNKDSGIIVRDNVSENDHGFLVYFNYAFPEVSVLNNIFFADNSVSPFLIRENPNNLHKHILFSQNLILNQSDSFTFEFRPEAALNSKKNKNNRTFENNIYLGKKLKGDYNHQVKPIPELRKFHRGFHHKSDELDFLMKNPINSISPSFIREEEKVVAIINDIAVFESEMERAKDDARTFLLTNKKEVNEKCLTEKAIEQMIYKKVQQEWMSKNQIFEAVVLHNLTSFMDQENSFRKVNATMDSIMFFGPHHFETRDYEAYVWAMAVEKLKRKMLHDELKMTEEELRKHMLVGDKDLVGPIWEKRGFEYSFNPIETSLLDQKYESFFQQKAKDAKVKYIDEDFFKE